MNKQPAVLAALAAVMGVAPATLTGEDRPSGLVHVSHAFSLVVHSPYPESAALFGPNGERGWSEGDWDPQFIYPQPGQDIAGTVFTIQHGSHKAVWITTAMDVQARHFQYVYFLAGLLVTIIDVNFEPLDGGNTKVVVRYERTALDEAANEQVQSLGAQDASSEKHWEEAINQYLAKRK